MKGYRVWRWDFKDEQKQREIFPAAPFRDPDFFNEIIKFVALFLHTSKFLIPCESSERWCVRWRKTKPILENIKFFFFVSLPHTGTQKYFKGIKAMMCCSFWYQNFGFVELEWGGVEQRDRKRRGKQKKWHTKPFTKKKVSKKDTTRNKKWFWCWTSHWSPSTSPVGRRSMSLYFLLLSWPCNGVEIDGLVWWFCHPVAGWTPPHPSRPACYFLGWKEKIERKNEWKEKR